MPSSQSTMMSRPSLGHRSISEQAPLYNPSTNPHSGSHLRASKAASGAQIATGSVLPHSPWLPLPPASNSKHSTLSVDVIDVEQIENFAPGQHRAPLSSASLASRRQARRGLSEGFSLHTNQHKSSRMAMAISAASALGPKSALRLDIAATADHFSAAASKSAGMIRGYSMPVATQEEHDEQQRIMALGLSPVGHYAANPAWWQYGWSSPGGVNHRHLQRQNGAPEFVSERQPSSQSKLATVMAAASTPAGPSPMSSSPLTTRPSSHASKTHSSCSPKMKNKHLPSIHQHTFQNTSSRSASSSPKIGRSPLSMISVNLPAVDQQLQQQQEQALSKSVHDTISPINNAFEIEMDALSQRFEQWSRSQALSTLRESRSDDQLSATANEDEDYFNLCHDEPQDNLVRGGADLGFLVRVTGGSDTSDEARTPRASSPRPLSKTALQYHNLEHLATHKDDAQHSFAETNRWSANFDFIHPDHLA
ncbi:uncharacterized protein UHO2_00093 [Ustilago hordei]|nr:uncharacterized protein UHO2_00093 [Ustilago hordei]SYW81569.1 uncharacterized protein UHO2_00093 [Ustilago hordei]